MYFNFPSSFDHFEGGLGDFPHQPSEGTRILHTLLFLGRHLMSITHVVISQSGLVYKLHMHALQKQAVLANYLATTAACLYKECGGCKTFCGRLVKFTQVSAPTA